MLKARFPRRKKIWSMSHPPIPDLACDRQFIDHDRTIPDDGLRGHLAEAHGLTFGDGVSIETLRAFHCRTHGVDKLLNTELAQLFRNLESVQPGTARRKKGAAA